MAGKITNYKINKVDLATRFLPSYSNNGANTGFKVNGVDIGRIFNTTLNNKLPPLTTTSLYKVNGTSVDNLLSAYAPFGVTITNVSKRFPEFANKAVQNIVQVPGDSTITVDVIKAPNIDTSPYTYQWIRLTGDGFFSATNPNTPTLSVVATEGTNVRANDVFVCKVRDIQGHTVYSNPIIVSNVVKDAGNLYANVNGTLEQTRLKIIQGPVGTITNSDLVWNYYVNATLTVSIEEVGGPSGVTCTTAPFTYTANTFNPRVPIFFSANVSAGQSIKSQWRIKAVNQANGTTSYSDPITIWFVEDTANLKAELMLPITSGWIGVDYLDADGVAISGMDLSTGMVPLKMKVEVPKNPANYTYSWSCDNPLVSIPTTANVPANTQWFEYTGKIQQHLPEATLTCTITETATGKTTTTSRKVYFAPLMGVASNTNGSDLTSFPSLSADGGYEKFFALGNFGDVVQTALKTTMSAQVVSYTWEYVSGDTRIACRNPSARWPTFYVPNITEVPPGATLNATWKLTISDSTYHSKVITLPISFIRSSFGFSLTSNLGSLNYRTPLNQQVTRTQVYVTDPSTTSVNFVATPIGDPSITYTVNWSISTASSNGASFSRTITGNTVNGTITWATGSSDYIKYIYLDANCYATSASLPFGNRPGSEGFLGVFKVADPANITVTNSTSTLSITGGPNTQATTSSTVKVTINEWVKPPLTFSWQHVSGDADIVPVVPTITHEPLRVSGGFTSPNSLTYDSHMTTAFRTTKAAPGTYTSVWKCRASNGDGVYKDGPDVTITANISAFSVTHDPLNYFGIAYLTQGTGVVTSAPFSVYVNGGSEPFTYEWIKGADALGTSSPMVCNSLNTASTTWTADTSAGPSAFYWTCKVTDGNGDVVNSAQILVYILAA